uniref:Uncharacterized protein n=1 Tax=Physcomitrium patens TaxID=3218 RepID=A0A7I4FGN3_PHYPA
MQTRAGRGPIFEDGPGFENSFRLFHGKDGVVPLKRASGEQNARSFTETLDAEDLSFHPLSARAATISLSSFGAGGPFGFDGFMARQNAKKPKEKKPKKETEPEKKRRSKLESHMHEAMGSEWLATGQCPIAKSFRAVSGVLPLVSKLLPKLPQGMKYRCPPAIVAARAALARTEAVKALRPQALPTKVLAIGMVGMALNVPLGVWREHTKKFSPQWFLAVHATIPFIAMLRKAVVMPKYAIAFTIGSAILGQAVGARAERIRLAKLKSSITPDQTEQLEPFKEALAVELGPQCISPATINVTAVNADVVGKVAIRDEASSQLQTELLPCDSVSSVIERGIHSSITHQRQDFPVVEQIDELCIEVPSKMGATHKRLTALPGTLHCGSEALVTCSMSPVSQPVLVN